MLIIIRLALFALCCAVSQAANFENMRLFERLGFGRRVDDDQSPSMNMVKTPGNSPMFMIKLPPSPYYYLNHVHDSSRVTPAHQFPRVPVEFTINGKPDKLYHFNLGVTPPMVDETTARTTTTTTTLAPPTTTEESPLLKISAAERLRQKYNNYYKRKASSTMKKYKYAYNGKPSTFYVMRGSSNRKPIYYRRLE